MKLALLPLAMLGCSSAMVPYTWRPDTRALQIRMDTTALDQALIIFHAALPNEGSACLYGRIVRDTLLLFTAEPASIAHADTMHLTFSRGHGLVGGCRKHSDGTHLPLVAISHTHPMVTKESGRACEQGEVDAKSLFSFPTVLASLVFCASGYGEVLWQDGRRRAFWY